MVFTIHTGVLSLAFAGAIVMGAVARRTNFCTMGGVSDWLIIGHTGRLRAWGFAIAVALSGLLVLEATGLVRLPDDTFPPYRTETFAWLRYLLGGLIFGIGMTLASGCGYRTLVRLGGGNLKSLVVLAFAAPAAYAMLWTDAFGVLFLSWIGPTSVRLSRLGIPSQELGALVSGALRVGHPGAMHLILGAIVALALLAFVFQSRDFRENPDHLLGGGVVGLAVAGGWLLTGGALGRSWKEYAEFASEVPSRVAVQSYTFISPMGDLLRYLRSPTQLALVNFGLAALLGMIVGASLHALATRSFRVEWFASAADFVRHAVGGVLMGVGGILSMGCTIGQGVTGMSTLALGSPLALLSIVLGCALTLRLQYRLMDGQGVGVALRKTLADARLFPARKA